jgi:hypothetical protein
MNIKVFAALQILILMDPRHFGKLDPEPHQSENGVI